MDKWISTLPSVIFKGVIIVKQHDKWHIDFKEFKSLYAAKGYILRQIRN